MRTLLLVPLLLLSACRSTPPPGADELLREGKAAFNSRDYAGATGLFLEAIDRAEAAGDSVALTEACALAANGYFVRNELEAGLPLLERAELLATPAEPRGWCRFLGVRGRYERQSGEPERALVTFVELYDYAMERKLYERAVDAAHMVAIVAPPEDQVEWAHRGIAAAEYSGEEGWLGPLWNNLGWTLDDLGRHEEALEALRTARGYHHRYGDEQAGLVADWSVAVELRKTGRLDAAEELQRATLASARRRHGAEPTPDTAYWLGMSLWELGEILLAREASEDAGQKFRQARAFLVESGAESSWPQGLAELDARIDATPGS